MIFDMTPGMIGLVLFVIFFLLLLIGSPIMVALGAATMACFYLLDIDMSMMIEKAATQLTAFPLMALPCFILAGALMESAGISRRLVHIAENMVGPIPGGLAISTALSCVFFGAISGSGPATTAAVGMLLIPAMTNRGYSSSYAAATTATAGGIGIIIPPSIPMVIFGVTSQQSISAMFMGGIVPGVLIAGSLSLLHYYKCRKMDTTGMDWSKVAMQHAFKDGIWAMLAPVMILGSIYAGVATPTEAAVIAIVYTVFVGVFIHRELDFRSFMGALKTTSWITGRILIMVFTAAAFGYLLTAYQLPKHIAEWMVNFTDNVYVVWAMVLVFLLILGMFMETLALIMLVTPVLLPIMVAYGVDPIHFGVILICCCAIGFSTPPLGENLFVATSISDVSLEEISVKALPFVLMNVMTVIILILFPSLVTFLPNLLK